MPDSNFLEVFQTIHRGELLDQCDEQLPELIQRIKERGGSGTLTIKINAKSKGDGRVEVAATVNAKPPQAKLPASIFYMNDENELQRNDPRQSDMAETPGFDRGMTS